MIKHAEWYLREKEAIDRLQGLQAIPYPEEVKRITWERNLNAFENERGLDKERKMKLQWKRTTGCIYSTQGYFTIQKVGRGWYNVYRNSKIIGTEKKLSDAKKSCEIQLAIENQISEIREGVNYESHIKD